MTDRAVVLVVDDEPGLADLYEAWLGDGYTTRVAYDGEEALELVDASVDVVLLDRRMPRLSGDEVLAEIEDRDLDCQVAMVTAVEPDFDVIDLGFDDYLVKPVSQDDLLGIVESLLERYEYDSRMTELLALLSKRFALQEQKSQAELEASDSYQRLVERIQGLRGEVDATVRDLSNTQAKSLFEGLDLTGQGEADD